MNHVPFNQNILLWRRARGLTQVELARRARVPQPNLSSIERGARDVSLRTLRALALALEVRPGILVDGVPPPAALKEPAALGRDALERIAAATVGQRALIQADERKVAALLQPLVQQRVRVLKGEAASGKRRTRAARLSWMTLRARYPETILNSLIQRVSERASQA